MTKHVSAFLEYFSSVKQSVHVKLIIGNGRLPSFMFLRSFDSMVGVARQKLTVNMADPINFLDILWKTDRPWLTPRVVLTENPFFCP